MLFLQRDKQPLEGQEFQDDAADDEIGDEVRRVEDDGVDGGVHALGRVAREEDDAAHEMAEEARGERERRRRDAVRTCARLARARPRLCQVLQKSAGVFVTIRASRTYHRGHVL